MSARIRTLGQIVSLLAAIFIVVIPVSVSIMWLFGDERMLLGGLPKLWFVPAGILFEPGTLTDAIRVSGAAVSILANIPLLAALWQIRCLFAACEAVDIFLSTAASRLRKFSAWIIAFALFNPIAGGVLSVVTSFNNSAGNRILSIGIEDTNIATAFLGTSVLVVAYMLEEAHKLSEENKSFI